MSKYIIEESDPYAIEILKFMGAKELVECKDCKWHYYHDLLKQDYCDIPNMQFGEVTPNGYCHRAERKTE